MKRTLLILSFLFSLVWLDSSAQTPDEWFKQKETQRRYLHKQIALLKLYAGYLKKGYDIAQDGLTTIQNIKDGDFNLHRNFFRSLKEVNPRIGNSAKIADIMVLQIYIVRELKGVSEFCNANEIFTPEEIRYVADVYTNMILLCDDSISELLVVIRSNESEMKDDERIVRIDKLYEDTLDKLAFAKAFGNDTRLLAKERAKEAFDFNTLRKHYDII